MIKQKRKNEKALMAATTKAKNEKPINQSGNSFMNNTTLPTEIQNVSTFQFEEISIRVIAINNEPWFIAKDLCNAINISNYRDAIERLDDDEKGVALTDTLGGKQEMKIVSESGMYTLILRCRDAVKKGSVPHRFRKWVTSEVLPQIRKTGKYENKKTTADERTGLRQAVSKLVSQKGLIYSDAYSLIHQRFNVQHIDELTPEQIPMAVEYIHKIVLEGELITDTSPKVKEDEIVVPYNLLYALYRQGQRGRQLGYEVSILLNSLLRLLGEEHGRPKLTGLAYDCQAQCIHWLDLAEKIIDKRNLTGVRA